MTNTVRPLRFMSAAVAMFVALAWVPAPAQDAPLRHEDSILVDRLREHVRFLAGDELAGRRPPEPGNARAAEYIAAAFREAGLEPLAGGDGYYHTFEYAAGLDLGGNNSLFITTPGNPISLLPGDRYNPLGFSSNGNASGALVFVGYGITAKDENYDDYAGIDAAGKIVVMMRYSPDGDNPHGALARYASFAQKVRTAREHGAAAVIVINQPSESSKPIPVTLDRNFTNVGLPVVFAAHTVFNTANDPSGRTLAALQKHIDSARTPASFVMAKHSAVLSVELHQRRVRVPNVVGVVPGSDPRLRDEIIVIGGHFDHLGMGGEGSLHGSHEPAIHHGADDNASGTAGVMELARMFAAARTNRRTLVFMGFNGEEMGLLGSAAFMANPPIAAERIVTMINLDMIGRLDSNLIVQGTGTSPWWNAMLNDYNAGRFPLKMVEDGFGPSDHSSFYAKNIPVLFFFTGLHSDYHRPSDTWEKVNYPGLGRVVNFVAGMARAIDARDERPPFTKTQSAARTSGGFKVYVGTIPDYGYDGKGLRLSGVAEGGPAQKAGLKEGDVIVRMGSREINNIYDYTDALGAFKPKERVDVVFLRGTERQTASVELGSR